MATLTIGQLGRATDTKIETIRYYEKIGLLPAPSRTTGEALRRLRRELRDTLASCRGRRIAECRVIRALSPVAAR